MPPLRAPVIALEPVLAMGEQLIVVRDEARALREAREPGGIQQEGLLDLVRREIERNAGARECMSW